MRNWLLTATWWQHALLAGTLMALGMTLAGRFLMTQGWPQAVITGVLVGVSFGAVMGPWAARQNAAFRGALGDLDPPDVRRATSPRHGPIPEDAQVRAAARRVTLMYHDQVVRQRPWALPFFVLMLGLAVWNGFTERAVWFWWPAAALWAVMVVSQLFLPRDLARRAELLSDPTDEP